MCVRTLLSSLRRLLRALCVWVPCLFPPPFRGTAPPPPPPPPSLPPSPSLLSPCLLLSFTAAREKARAERGGEEEAARGRRKEKWEEDRFAATEKKERGEKIKRGTRGEGGVLCEEYIYPPIRKRKGTAGRSKGRVVGCTGVRYSRPPSYSYPAGFPPLFLLASLFNASLVFAGGKRGGKGFSRGRGEGKRRKRETWRWEGQTVAGRDENGGKDERTPLLTTQFSSKGGCS